MHFFVSISRVLLAVMYIAFWIILDMALGLEPLGRDHGWSP